MNRIKHLLKSQLRKKGLYVEKSTSKKDVVSLIRKLHPVKTAIPLIRLGSQKDGGYLVPDDFENVLACFSPGVGLKSEFELDCLSRGMKVFLADKSVEKTAVNNANLEFIKKYMCPYTNEDFITINDWIEGAIGENQEDIIIQMDIEGFEYSCLLNLSERLLKQSRIIVFKFHNLHKLWNKEFFKIAKLTFDKLLLHHNCVHIHPNKDQNPISYMAWSCRLL